MSMAEPPAREGVEKGRTRMEQVIAPVAFVVFLVLWVGFAAALVVNQAWLDQAWDWVRSLPLLLQVVVWLLFLPIVAGLWVWHTDWALAVRLTVVAGLAVATLYMFLPKGILGIKP